jgi:hypothetical protein
MGAIISNMKSIRHAINKLYRRGQRLKSSLKSSQTVIVQNDVEHGTTAIFGSFGHLPPIHGPPSQVIMSTAHLTQDEWLAADHGQGLPPILVPFLGKLYNGDDFGSYPEAKGWMAIFRNPALAESRKNEVEIFFQEWLFFGTLVEVFRALFIDVRQEDFTHTDSSGAKWITTTPLRVYLNSMARGASQYVDSPASLERRRLQIAAIQKCLVEVNEITNRTYKFNGATHRAIDRLVRPEIGLSFQILGSTLENAVSSLLRVGETNTSARGSRLNWHISELLNSRLLQNGLCPYAIARLVRGFRPDALYFLSLLHYPPIEGEHSECSARDCKFEIVDEKSYEPRHLEPNCTCDYVAVDSAKLCAILAKGQIPILPIKEPHTRVGNSIAVTAATSDIDYVAISHVWSDKIGNVNSNSIPGCMFKRLESFIRAVGRQEGLSRGGKPLAFWIDTLCIPVGRHLDEYRKEAIRLMKSTYQSAARVLVLDSVLQWIPVPASQQELLLRIVTGKWHRRLWTFQEYAIANELCFACSNGIINDERLIRGMYECSLNDPLGLARAASCLDRDSEGAYLRSRRVYKDNRDPSERLAFLFGSLADRKTTKADDESICLATLMDFQIGDILKADGDQRMKLFYSKCDSIPPDVLFQFGPKIQDPGFRWAPRSFLRESSLLNRNIAGLGEMACPRDSILGLKIPYRIFMLKPIFSDAGTHFETPPTRRIFFKDIFSSTWHMVTIVTTDDRPEEAFSPQSITKLHQPALIIRWWAPSEHTGQFAWLQQGALVSIQKERTQNGTLANYEVMVQVRELTRREYDATWADREWPFLEAAVTGVDVMNSERVILEAVRLPEETPFWVA